MWKALRVIGIIGTKKGRQKGSQCRKTMVVEDTIYWCSEIAGSATDCNRFFHVYKGIKNIVLDRS